MTVTELRDEATRVVQRNADGLIDLSHRIHARPEVAWEEVRASGWVADAMAAGGFDVTPQAYGVATAVEAVRGEGPMTVVVCAEYDALPGLGHACGHNVIAASCGGGGPSRSVPLAEELGLRVRVSALPRKKAPAASSSSRGGALRSGRISRSWSIRRRSTSPSARRSRSPTATSPTREGLARRRVSRVESTLGRVPLARRWRSRCSASSCPSDSRVHGSPVRWRGCTERDPERTEGRWYVRGRHARRSCTVEDRVRKCFEAGALATGSTLRSRPESKPYAEFLTDGRRRGHGYRERGRPRSSSRPSTAGIADEPCHHRPGQRLPGDPSHPPVHRHRLATRCQPSAGVCCCPASPAADRAVIDAATALALTVADVASDTHQRERLLAGSARGSHA